MKHFKTNSDIGAVLVGNTAWTFAVPNMGGDGTTDVFIGTKEEIQKERYTQYHSEDFIKGSNGIRHNIVFISSVQGKFGIYENDCDYTDQKALKNPIEVLEGRYGVYRGEMCVAFIKWE